MGVSEKIGERGRKRIIFITLGFVLLAAYLFFVFSVWKNTEFVTLSWLKLFKSGGIISDASKRKLIFAALSALFAAVSATLSMIFISGRGHRPSVTAGAVALSLIPVWRLISIAMRIYMFCGSSIGSEGIRERFVKNSGALEVIGLLLIAVIGAVAFFSRRANEYGDDLRPGGTLDKKRERTLAALTAKGYRLTGLILTVYDGEKTAIAIYKDDADYAADEGKCGNPADALAEEMKTLLPGYAVEIEISKR
jgi:hypothetical protein